MILRLTTTHENRVILSAAKNLALALLIGPFLSRARFFAEFTLSPQSEILRCAQDDSEGFRMTAHFQVSEGSQ